MNSPETDIRHLLREEIDSAQWDRCVLQAKNSLIYARTFYLDVMAKNWDGLVFGDYEAVMPLTWKRKYGISYLYQPAFTAQLGMFYRNDPDGRILEEFIVRAKKHFRFCEINLNFANTIRDGKAMTNYVVSLENPYIEIRAGYKKRLLENLDEAGSFSLRYDRSENFGAVIQLYKSQYGDRIPHIRQSDYDHFKRLCQELQNRDMLFIRQVRDKSGELLNSSIFLCDDFRIYNIMSVSLPAGRVKRAHFYLLDQLIVEFATKKMTLDLEGSDVPGIAEFYRKFGPVDQSYPFLKYNNLPFPFRLFK